MAVTAPVTGAANGIEALAENWPGPPAPEAFDPNPIGPSAQAAGHAADTFYANAGGAEGRTTASSSTAGSNCNDPGGAAALRRLAESEWVNDFIKPTGMQDSELARKAIKAAFDYNDLKQVARKVSMAGGKTGKLKLTDAERRIWDCKEAIQKNWNNYSKYFR
jgi:hypothetical protein